jgi:hypothetical protein
MFSPRLLANITVATANIDRTNHSAIQPMTVFIMTNGLDDTNKLMTQNAGKSSIALDQFQISRTNTCHAQAN